MRLEGRDKVLLDTLAPPVRETGWAVVVSDDDGVVAVLGPHASELDANACRDIIRPGPEREVAVVPMRRATVHDIHDRRAQEVGAAVSELLRECDSWDDVPSPHHEPGDCSWSSRP